MMSSGWAQFFVKSPYPEQNTPQIMKRVDETLLTRGGFLVTSPFGGNNNLPTQREDGTFEARALHEDSIYWVRLILTEHHGLEIVREVIHPY